MFRGLNLVIWGLFSTFPALVMPDPKTRQNSTETFFDRIDEK